MTETTRRAGRVRASELVGRGWLNTGGKQVTLEDLRGKIVVLDFWTFCCINCLHVLDEMRPWRSSTPMCWSPWGCTHRSLSTRG